jgi:hypothetical protein
LSVVLRVSAFVIQSVNGYAPSPDVSNG